jgi:hypothetical protein
MDCSTFAFDLHVLGTPPALILSQDQTLKLKLFALRLAPSRRLGSDRTCLTRSLLIGSRIPTLALACARALVGKPTVGSEAAEATEEPRWVVKFASPGLTQMRELRRSADTRRAVRLRPPSRLAALRQTPSNLMCLHVLSSFQRTETPRPGAAPHPYGQGRR